MAKPPTKKLTFILNGFDGEELNKAEIKKVACVKIDSKDRQFIYFEKNDGEDEWKLTYTEKTIPDIKKLSSIILFRET